MLQQIATLLLGRGAYAWIGYNFAGDMPQTNMACVHVLGNFSWHLHSSSRWCG